ncbi:hypothetical protein JCM9279_003353 [Rhodotorula babjevae]
MASFASLPLELVSRIVGMAHEHDQAWIGFSICNTGIKTRLGFDHLRDHDVSDARVDSWEAPYGRGVRALLQVDRRTRAAAVPHFYERLTARTTGSAYFRFRVLGHPPGLHVRHLDCRLTDYACNPLSLACALEALPNLTSLAVDSKTLSFVHGTVVGEGPEMLAIALQHALGRITSLEVRTGTDDDLKYALAHVNKQRLRRLAVRFAPSLVNMDDEPVADFNTFEALVEVELGASRPERRLWLQEHLRLPHVRSLSLVCGAFQKPATYEDALIFAHHVAPAVQTLTIVAIPEVKGGRLEPSSPSPLLPTLRTLRLDLFGPYGLNCLHLPDLPAVEHLHITHGTCDGVHPLSGLEPTRPTALRTVTSSYQELYPVSLAPQDKAEWDKLGIRIVDEWSPESWDWRRFEDDDEQDEMKDAEEGVEGLARLFGWATDRARWLLRVGDAHGLDELSDMARRLRERFVIERS